MIRSKRQSDIGALCDLHTPLTDDEKAVLAKVWGAGPLEPEARVRQPYDSLTVKLRRQYHAWDRN